MKKGFLFIFTLLMLISLTACFLFAPRTEAVNIKLFFPTQKGNFDFEERTVEVSQGTDALLTSAIIELLKGPKEERFTSAIPDGTNLLDATVEDNVATLNLSGEFSGFAGVMDEAHALISLVNTSTELPEIDEVTIKVEGKDLVAPSGKPYGALAKYDLETLKREAMSQEIVLYFPDDNAMYLIPEIRKVVIDGPKEAVVIQELLKGPENPDLAPVNIPEGARLLSIEVEDGTAFVDFSKELKENHSGGSTGEAMTIDPIVNSLTELPEIHAVQFLIEGKSEEFLAGHVIFSEPFRRNVDVIKR